MSESLQVVCPHCDAVNRLPAARLGQAPKCGRCKRPLFSGEAVELRADNFPRHVGQSGIPVVVDFWAPWCGPCRMMAPAFAAAARQLEPAARLVKVNTEEEQGLAATFSIRSIPTLAIFKGGHEVARQAGALTTPQLVAWIRGHL
jgi:thioredoxin 2